MNKKIMKRDVVYHVLSYKKLLLALREGYLKSPTKGWKTINEAERFSKQTGRRIILRIHILNAKQYEGHRGQALVTNNIVYIPNAII